MLLVMGCVVALLGAAGWTAVLMRRTRIRRRVLVSLHTGKALDGVLWARHGRLVVLRDARLLQPGVEPTPLDGEVVVERTQIEFVQALP